MSEILFIHPHTLLDNIGKIINKVGSEKFFSSPEEDVKKAREGFFAYFFTLAMKKYTNRDWWLTQYPEAVRNYPDFDLISVGDETNPIIVEKVELTGVYPHFENFEKMMEVINKKKNKYGNKSLDFSLLIFINHEKSEDYLDFLRKNLISHDPFISIWTIHLRFKNPMEVKRVVACRISPGPFERIEADIDDPKIHKLQSLPDFLDSKQVDGSQFFSFKPNFIKSYLKRKK